MQRTPEPELMDDAAQARAYAEADFALPHQYFVTLFQSRLAGACPRGPDKRVLDLGCGPGDITVRFARAFPDTHIDALDGAEAMLAHARQRLARPDHAALAARIRLLHDTLPGAALPAAHYRLIISNSLLHHLADPGVLWDTVRACAPPGTPVFIMDLMRPDSPAHAEALTHRYAADAPAVLRHDFHHSLHAAYRPEEVLAQLEAAGLRPPMAQAVDADHATDPTSGLRVEVVSDRHLIVYGHVPTPAAH